MILVVVLQQVFHDLLQRLLEKHAFACLVKFLPKIRHFQIFAEYVVLKLILANEEEILDRCLLHLVQVVLELDVDSLLVGEQKASCKCHVVLVLLALVALLDLTVFAELVDHTLVAWGVERAALSCIIDLASV